MADQGQGMRAGAAGSAAAIYSTLIPEWARRRAKDLFWWTFDWEGASPLAVSQTSSRTVQVDADADAMIVALSGRVSDAGAFTVPPGIIPIKLELKDTGSGRDFMDRPALWEDIVGTAQLPGFVAYPKVVPASSIIRATAQNLDAANPWDVHLTLVGFKIFHFEEDRPPRGG